MYQTIKQISQTLVASLTISFYLGGISQARTITEISPATGAGLGDVVCLQVQSPVTTPFPNNDNSIDASPNQILNLADIPCGGDTFQAVAPIDIQFVVEPSGGTTEYFFSQTIVNNTDYTWDGFNFKIGFGTGDEFAPPELILVPSGFAIPDFDFNGSGYDPQPTSSKFTQLVEDGSFNLLWSGGTVAPGESVDFTFSIDVPDDLDGNNFYNSFTIRQVPIAASVPEQSSTNSLLALLGLFVSSLAFKHKPI